MERKISKQRGTRQRDSKQGGSEQGGLELGGSEQGGLKEECSELQAPDSEQGGLEPKETPLCSVAPRNQAVVNAECDVKPLRFIKVATFNVRGCIDPVKRMRFGQKFKRQNMDVCALTCTMMHGDGQMMFGDVAGRVSGVGGGFDAGVQGVALLLSARLLQYVEEWKLISGRLMWVRLNINKECWVFVCAFGPGSENNNNEIQKFWYELTECVASFKRNEYVVVLGDLNARVGDQVVQGIVGKYGVPGVDDNGARLLHMCDEQELVVGNTFFNKKGLHRYTRISVVDGVVTDRALVDYVLISKRVKDRLVDVNVKKVVSVRVSDHYVVEARLSLVSKLVHPFKVYKAKADVLKEQEFEKFQKEKNTE